MEYVQSSPREQRFSARAMGKVAPGFPRQLSASAEFWDNPICSIMHDEASYCIIVSWKQYATRIQFRYIHKKLLSRLSANTVSSRFQATTPLYRPFLPRTDPGLSMSGFRERCSAACALPPVNSQTHTLASSLSATSSRPLRPALSAGTSIGWKKRKNGFRQ